METTLSLINKEVHINAFYFRQNKNFKTFPKQMELEGTQYTFVESGLRFLVRKGQQFIELFDMSDGRNIYRLRQESGHWILVGIRSGA